MEKLDFANLPEIETINTLETNLKRVHKEQTKIPQVIKKFRRRTSRLDEFKRNIDLRITALASKIEEEEFKKLNALDANLEAMETQYKDELRQTKKNLQARTLALTVAPFLIAHGQIFTQRDKRGDTWRAKIEVTEDFMLTFNPWDDFTKTLDVSFFETIARRVKLLRKQLEDLPKQLSFFTNYNNSLSGEGGVIEHDWKPSKEILKLEDWAQKQDYTKNATEFDVQIRFNPALFWKFVFWLFSKHET